MCFNVGKVDRTLRVVAGVGIIGFGWMSDSLVVSILGAIPLITGLVGFCPVYPLFKINTGCDKN